MNYQRKILILLLSFFITMQSTPWKKFDFTSFYLFTRAFSSILLIFIPFKSITNKSVQKINTEKVVSAYERVTSLCEEKETIEKKIENVLAKDAENHTKDSAEKIRMLKEKQKNIEIELKKEEDRRKKKKNCSIYQQIIKKISTPNPFGCYKTPKEILEEQKPYIQKTYIYFPLIGKTVNLALTIFIKNEKTHTQKQFLPNQNNLTAQVCTKKEINLYKNQINTTNANIKTASTKEPNQSSTPSYASHSEQIETAKPEISKKDINKLKSFINILAAPLMIKIFHE